MILIKLDFRHFVGFVNQERVREVLNEQKPGTFLFRFCNSLEGAFSLSG